MMRTILWKQKNFYPLFWTQFCGALNDNFLKNSLIILITFREFSIANLPVAEMVPLAGGIFILPFFLFSGMAGQIADRFEKSKIIRLVKLAEIAIMAFAFYGFMTNRFEFLLGVLFVMGTHSSFFGPVKYGIIPQHVAPEDLIGANALVEAGTFVAILFGTIAGGLVVAITDGGTLIASVAMMALAIVGYLFSRSIPTAPAQAPDLKLQWDPVRPTWDILRFACSRRDTFLRILAASWFWCFGAAILLALPPYVKQVMGTNERVLTLLLTVWSVGIGMGSLLCGRLSRRGVELALVPLGAIGMTAFALALGLTGNAESFAAAFGPDPGVAQVLSSARGWLVMLWILGVTVSAGLYIVPLTTLMQSAEEKSHVSRVIAANNLFNALFIVLSSVILFTSSRFGLTLSQTYIVLGAMNVAVTGACFAAAPEYPRRFLVWLREGPRATLES